MKRRPTHMEISLTQRVEEDRATESRRVSHRRAAISQDGGIETRKESTCSNIWIGADPCAIGVVGDGLQSSKPGRYHSQ